MRKPFETGLWDERVDYSGPRAPGRAIFFAGLIQSLSFTGAKLLRGGKIG
jgi:hypothetical protein